MNQRLSQCHLPRSSPNARIYVDQKQKVFMKARSWLQANPLSCSSTKFGGCVNPNTTRRQIVTEEHIDATHRGNTLSHEGHPKGFNTLQCPLIMATRIETLSMMFPPRFQSHAIPSQASNGQCCLRAIAKRLFSTRDRAPTAW